MLICVSVTSHVSIQEHMGYVGLWTGMFMVTSAFSLNFAVKEKASSKRWFMGDPVVTALTECTLVSRWDFPPLYLHHVSCCVGNMLFCSASLHWRCGLCWAFLYPLGIELGQTQRRNLESPCQISELMHAGIYAWVDKQIVSLRR